MNEKSSKFKDEKLIAKITALTDGLVYVSETDSDLQTFFAGPVTNDDIVPMITQLDPRTPVEEISFEDFFGRLSTERDWYGDEEKKRAERFARLNEQLMENLRGLKVLKVGHIQKTIYVAGVSRNNNLLGVKMNAVET
jgi:hypothetical protein